MPALWMIALFQVVVPLLLLGVLAFSRQPGRWLWAMHALAFGMVLSFMWASARWDLSSLYLRHLLPILWLVACVVGYRRIRAPEGKPKRGQAIAAFATKAVLVVLIVAMSGFNWFSFRGYVRPEGAVDLASPLRGARFVVLHGGASPFTNAHFRIRPQSYALDLLGLNALGRRADFLGDSRELASYEIFGAPIYSPCAGRIAAAVDLCADQIPPETDVEHLAGNHVLIECAGVEVLLAHMRHGSVRVQVGDDVTPETVLGQVGNTGNTSEPHLHIHVERGGEPGTILDGESVPMTLDGRFLVRGDTLDE